MPLTISSFQIPLSPSLPYILEDIYLRGGYRSVATQAIMNAIPGPARKAGMLVYCADADTVFQLGADKVTFKPFASGGGGSAGGRFTNVLEVGSLGPTEHRDLTVELSAISAMVLRLALNVKGVMVQVFSKADMSDTNPYTFLSSEALLEDDGTTMVDSAVLKGRRFAFISNEDGSTTHHLRITNVSDADTVEPVLTLKYLRLE